MKRFWTLILVLATCGFINNVYSQKIKAIKEASRNGYNFWVYEPGKDTTMAKGEKQPLVIFLHGASLKGTDMRRVLKYGPLNAIDRGIKINAYVMAPQTQGNWEADKVWKCVEWVKAHYPIDTNRISVIGMSLGGFGTFEVSTKYYDRLSAGMMLCGGNTNENYCGLTKMPFWIMHGTADKAVPISRSNSIVSAMAACGDTSRLMYTKLHGANHSYPAKIFYLTETYDWLTSHSLTDENRAINRNTPIDQNMISGAYGRLTGVTGAVAITTPQAPAEQDTTAKNDVQQTEKAATDSTKVTKEASEAPKKEQTDVQRKSNPKYHIVRKGNTLGGIARKYHTTVKKLCQLNNIKNPDELKEGQKIKLPQSK